MKIYQYAVPVGLFLLATVINQLGTTALEDVMEVGGLLVTFGLLAALTKAKRSERGLRGLR